MFLGRGKDLRGDIQWGGRQRSYRLHLPPGADGRPLPLVVVLHGGGGDMTAAARQTRFDAEADRAGFIVVYPNGSGLLPDRLLVWNAGTCCGYAVKHDVDDVGFIRALVGELKARHAIDATRIYATGFSNGGMMSYRLACEVSELFAAIAPVAATQTLHGSMPSHPVSILHIHGSADENVPLRGGLGRKSLDEDSSRPPVSQSIRFWVERNGTVETPATSQHRGIRREVYTGGREGSEVEFWLIDGGGHAWPGGDRLMNWLDAPSKELDATAAIWAFFAAHSKA
jgi:polyhydroxybutyrate depolymerase